MWKSTRHLSDFSFICIPVAGAPSLRMQITRHIFNESFFLLLQLLMKSHYSIITIILLSALYGHTRMKSPNRRPQSDHVECGARPRPSKAQTWAHRSLTKKTACLHSTGHFTKKIFKKFGNFTKISQKFHNFTKFPHNFTSSAQFHNFTKIPQILQKSRTIPQFDNSANFTKIPQIFTILQKFRKFYKNSAKFRVETWDTKQMRR